MFSCAQILKATRGKLVNGSADTWVKDISIDSRTIQKGFAFIAIKGNNFDGHDFIGAAIKKGASCIVKTDKNKQKATGRIACIEVKDTLKALGDIANFWRKRFDVPVIAVTGSNGKTTAKDMIAWVLSAQFRVLKNEGTKNNQVGLPLTLLKLDDTYDIVVLELGTNHPGEIGYLSRVARPNIGVIANIGTAHLGYFGNLARVFKEKSALIHNLDNPAIAVLNADDRFLKNEVTRKAKRPFVLGFGIKNQSDFFATDIKQHRQALVFSINLKQKIKLQTLGYHNIYNALIAAAIAKNFGLSYREIALRLAGFDFPAGRLKLVKSKNIRFIDDTYNSNPDSLQAALNALEKFQVRGRKIFIMGDMLELGSFARAFHIRAGKDITKVCDVFITVGRLAKFAGQAAKGCGFNMKNIFTCRSSQEAAKILRKKLSLQSDDIVLVKGSRAMRMEEVLK